MARWAAACMVGLALAHAGPLPSQTAEQKQASKEHFAQGVVLFDQGDYASALAEFQVSHELYPHWKILRNIGMCHYKLGESLEAAAVFSDFLEEGGADIDAAAAQEVQGILKELRSKLGLFRLTGDFSGAVLTIDGEVRAAGSEGKDIFLTPGVHHVTITKGEKVIIEKDMAIESGEEKEVFVAASKDADEKGGAGGGPGVESTPKPAVGGGETGKVAVAEDAGKTVMKKAGWAALGIAAAMLVPGAILGGLTIRENALMKDDEKAYRDKFDVLSEHELDLLRESRDDHYDRGVTYSIASSILFGVAGAASLAAVVLLPMAYKAGAKEKKQSLRIFSGGDAVGLVLAW
jgi:tetratricopeptide (TPR) repeat protein